MKKIIILSLLIIAGVIGISQFAFAENGTLWLMPASGNKNVGTIFDVLVQADPQGNEICVVKGTLSFDNLTCQNITIVSGILVQAAPTCNSPNFILGIPKCTTSLQDILTVSVKGNNAGQANLSFSDVNVLSSGSVVAFNASAGTYNITAIASSTSGPQSTVQNAEQTAELQPLEPASEETGIEEVETTSLNQPAAVGQTGLAALFSNWIGWLILALIVAALVTWWIYSAKKEEEKKQ